jgi:WD40 repeat protein
LVGNKGEGMKKLIILMIVLITQTSQWVDAQDGDTINIQAIQWSSDGTYLAVAGASATLGSLQVINTVENRLIYHFESITTAFTSIAWSPDNRFIAVGGYDQTIQIINITNQQTVATLRGHRATVTDLDWSADGKFLASSGNWDMITIIWEMTSYIQQRVIKYGELFPNTVGFDPQSQWVAVGGEGGIQIYSIQNASQPPTVFATNGNVGSLVWSADGSRIAFGTQVFPSIVNPSRVVSSQVSIIDTTTGEIILSAQTGDLSIYGIAWSPDNSLMVTHSEDGAVRVWDSVSGIQVAAYDNGTLRYPSDPTFSPLGGRLAFGTTVEVASIAPSVQTQSSDLSDVMLSMAVQIVVPAPSLERLNAIAAGCAAVADAQSGRPLLALPSVTDANLIEFAMRIETLPADTLSPSCAADLRLMAEALASEQGTDIMPTPTP